MTTPAYLSMLVLGGSAGTIAAALFGLNRSLNRARWSGVDRAPVLLVAAIVLIGWLAAATGLAWLGTYEGGPDRLPTIQLGILIPIAVGALLIGRSATMSRIIDAIPQEWLIGVQVLRGLGAIFLVLYAAGSMPALFALPAGIGDVFVASVAPVVAWAHARNLDVSAGAVAAWNLLGIADLVVAVGTGFVTTPSPLQLTAFDNPNTLIAAYPLVLIPTYLVPLWIVLHIASLAKLRRTRSRSSARRGAAAASV